MFTNSLSFVFVLADDWKFILGFYFLTRALWVSAVFAVVRLSVTFVYCIQTAKGFVKLLSQPSSPIILVLGPKRQY